MRPATEEDGPRIAELAAAAGGTGWWGREQRTGPDHPDRKRYVEVDGERIIGYGCIWRRQGTVFGLDALVHPDGRRHGLGGKILDRLFEDLAAYGATAVESRIDADHVAALTFMVRCGFFELNRLERVRLDLDQAQIEETTPEGVTIVSLAETRDPDRLRELHAMVSAGFADRPVRYLEPFAERPLEHFVAELDAAIADACFIASASGKCVGFSGLTAGPEPGTLTAFMTVIAPDHRHHGIATALKQRTIAYGKRNGYRAIFSNSPNRDMQELNEMLGFKRSAASEIRMGRRL